MLKTLILDANDSFVWNIYRYAGKLGGNPTCLRVDVDWEEVTRQNPTHLILSPGPGHPNDTPMFRCAYEYWRGRVPILGVCLGHQAIGSYNGGNVVVNYRQVHGKTSLVNHDGTGLFQGLPSPFKVMRYHSLVVEAGTMPSCLKVKAVVKPEGKTKRPSEVMAIQHTEHKNIWGVQFHPESFFTKGGEQIIANFLAME